MNMWIQQFSMTFPKLLDFFFVKDFSRPGNNRFKIPGLFQVFHDRTNPDTKFSLSRPNKTVGNYIFLKTLHLKQQYEFWII